LKKLLERLRKEELIGFLLEYAKSDPKFVNAVNVRFREPEFAEELKKIRYKIAKALDHVSDYSTHDSWGHVDFYIGDIVEEILQRAGQGHIRLAFSEMELLYRKLLECFEYQGECEISDVAEYCCIEDMSKIAELAVSQEDKEYIFGKCIELAELEEGKDYGADYEDKLLSIAVKFVTSKNCEVLENAISRFDGTRREKEFKQIRMEIISRTEGEGI